MPQCSWYPRMPGSISKTVEHGSLIKRRHNRKAHGECRCGRSCLDDLVNELWLLKDVRGRQCVRSMRSGNQRRGPKHL